MKKQTQIIITEDFRSKEPEERRKNLNKIVLQLIRKEVEGETASGYNIHGEARE